MSFAQKMASGSLSRLVLTNRTRATALVPKPYTQQKVFAGGNCKAGPKPAAKGEFTRVWAGGKKAGAPRGGMNFGWTRGASQVKGTGGVPARHL